MALRSIISTYWNVSKTRVKATYVVALFVAVLTVFFFNTSESGADTRKTLAPDFVADAIPGAVLCGSGGMTFMMWDVYDAELFASDLSACGDTTNAQALTLMYKRDFSGEDIADRSVKEMRGLKNKAADDEILLAAWHKEMRELFPNVKKGDILTGILLPEKESRFYHNGRLIGAITDERFGMNFFAIWLSEHTSEPELRASLLKNTRL